MYTIIFRQLRYIILVSLICILLTGSEIFAAVHRNIGLSFLIKSWTSEEVAQRKNFSHLTVTWFSESPCKIQNGQNQLYLTNHEILGLAELSAQRMAEAVDAFCADPNIAKKFLIKATGLEKAGQHSDALYWSKVAHSIYPSLDDPSFEKFADNAFLVRDLPQAINWLDLHVTYHSSDERAWNKLAYYSQLLMRWDLSTIDNIAPYYQKFVEHHQNNFVINGTFSFEDLGWQHSQHTDTISQYGITAEGAYLIGVDQGTHAGWIQILRLPPGQKVTFSARISTSGNDSFIVKPLYWEHTSNGIHGHEYQVEITGTTSWKSYSTTFEIPQSEQGIALYPAHASGVGTVWITDVSLKRIIQ